MGAKEAFAESHKNRNMEDGVGTRYLAESRKQRGFLEGTHEQEGQGHERENQKKLPNISQVDWELLHLQEFSSSRCPSAGLISLV
jgi:hypothetical protein